MTKAVRISDSDNVATLLSDCPTGDEIRVVGQAEEMRLKAGEAIPQGHKVALLSIPAGAKVVKFATSIGHARRPIASGAWVHLHNLASDYDERSQTLDVKSGAPTDTVYR